MAMYVVDDEIKGEELQFVEIEFDPGEVAVGEAGISMDTVFGSDDAEA